MYFLVQISHFHSISTIWEQDPFYWSVLMYPHKPGHSSMAGWWIISVNLRLDLISLLQSVHLLWAWTQLGATGWGLSCLEFWASLAPSFTWLPANYYFLWDWTLNTHPQLVQSFTFSPPLLCLSVGDSGVACSYCVSPGLNSSSHVMSPVSGRRLCWLPLSSLNFLCSFFLWASVLTLDFPGSRGPTNLTFLELLHCSIWMAPHRVTLYLLLSAPSTCQKSLLKAWE